MKIYCNKNEFYKAINNVSQAIPSRTPTKILEGILVKIENNKIKVTGSDTNITINSFIEIESNENVSFVMPAKIVTTMISKLTEEEIMLDYKEDENKITIRSGSSKFDVICFSAEEYPLIKLNEENKKIAIKKEAFKKLVEKTAFSASTDSVNTTLTGIYIEIKNNNIRMVTTDGIRMSVYNENIESNENISIIVPAKMLLTALKIIDDNGDENIYIEITENKLIMTFDNNKIVINTLNGKFIDYERILKRETTLEIRIQKDELKRSIDRASLFAAYQKNNLISLDIEDNNLKIASISEEGSVEENIEIIKEGNDLRIGFNAKFMYDALKVIDEEEIRIKMKDSISPCIINPLSGEKYTYFILPVRMN